MLFGRALRTFQRRVTQWRCRHGPPKEVCFAQVREPGRSLQFDWTHAKELEITIGGQPDATVRQAAFTAGFDDQLYFTRVFHRIEGLTPSDYKRAVLNVDGAIALKATEADIRRLQRAVFHDSSRRTLGSSIHMQFLSICPCGARV